MWRTLLTCRNSLGDVYCSVLAKVLRSSMHRNEIWLAIVKLPILLVECRPQSSAIAHLATLTMQHLRLHKTVTVSIHSENYRFASKRNISAAHHFRWHVVKETKNKNRNEMECHRPSNNECVFSPFCICNTWISVVTHPWSNKRKNNVKTHFVSSTNTTIEANLFVRL